MTKSPEISSGLKTNPEHKKHMSKKALVGRLAVALFIIANAGMGVKHHVDFETPNTPAGIWQDVKGIPTEWLYTILKWQQDRAINEELNKPVPPIFDNKADTQLIQTGVNAVKATSEELSSLFKNNTQPLEKQDNFLPQIALLFPAKLENGDKVTVSTHYINQGLNPITGKIERENVGKDIIFSRSGTEIVVPVDGAEIFQLDPLIVNNKPYFRGIIMRFNGADNTINELVIRTDDDVRQFQAMDNIKNAPIVNVRGGQTIPTEKGIILDGGTVIIKTSNSNARISFNVGVYSPDYSKSLPANIVFPTNDNNQLLYLALDQ